MSGRTLGGWRVAARLARREVRRRPGRTALVAALVAVPVAGMLLGAAFVRTDGLSPAERWRLVNGRADAVLYYDTEVPPATLPPGSREVAFQETWRTAGTTGGRFCRCMLTDMPIVPLTDGMVMVTAGRAPAAPDEVLLSPEAVEALGADLGDHLELARPLVIDATVVGVGADAAWLDTPMVLLPPGALDAPDPYGSPTRLVDLPDDLTPEETAAFATGAGPHSMAPDRITNWSPWSRGGADQGIRWTLVAGAGGLTVLGVVVAAAFAASARRQLVVLGQLAANGATPALLRRVLFLQGTVTGVVGSAVGLGLGAAALAVARPHTDLLFDHAVVGWEVRLLDVVPIVLLAVVAATIAALVPALGASRISVLTALAGRRPLGRVSARRTATGVAAAFGGTALLGFSAGSDAGGSPATVAGLAGPVLLLLGMCAATPAAVTVLQPLAGAVRGPWRLAARSLFRQRTRTSALVSAICGVSAVAVASAALGLAVERDSRANRLTHEPPPEVVRVRAQAPLDFLDVVPAPAAVEEAAGWARAALPGTERFDIAEVVQAGELVMPTFTPRRFVSAHGGPALDGLHIPPQVLVADAEFEAAYRPGVETRRLLDEVGAVYVGPSSGRVTVEAGVPEVPTRPDGELVVPRPVSFEAAVLGPEDAPGLGAGALLLTPEKTRELGFTPAVTGVVLRAPGPLDGEQRDAVEQVGLRAQAAREDAEGDAAGSWTPPTPEQAAANPYVSVDYRDTGRYVGAGLVETVPASVALLFGLLVVAIGLALAAVETRDERAVLAVLGASPRAVRRADGAKAFLLTLLGGALAVPVGLLPAMVVGRLSGDPLEVTVPWRTLALLLVVVPLLCAGLTAAVSGLALRFRPVRPTVSRG